LEEDEAPRHPANPPHGQRILVVEPDGESRDALCALLECWGHRVVVATTGQQALGFAVEMRLDAIVFSFSLPDMEGVDFARTVRGIRLTPAPELVGYSDLPESAEAPVDMLIRKPDLRALERLFDPAARRHGVPTLPLRRARPR
jgi:CheY-like chemotaxis protein